MVEPMLGFNVPDEPEINNLNYLPNWLDSQQAWEVFDLMKTQLPWSQGELQMFGKRVKIPRLECFLADDHIEYSYSGQRLKRVDWPDFLTPLLVQLRKLCQRPLNACLANFYRDGNDKVGWHADDEPELGTNPLIASISLGATRTFQIRHNEKEIKKSIALEHGSLLIMDQNFQSEWKHQIPLEKSILGSRINLTFRTII